jgi:transposase
VDEICTTKSTIPTHEWSAKNRPVKLDYRQFARECIATIAAISIENGVDLVMNTGQSVNIQKFCQFLVALRRKYKMDSISIFMDQLAVHRSLVVQRKMEELGMRCIFNAAYSPDYNPIEGVFSVAKRKIKQERLKDIMNKRKRELEGLIKD